jgi:biopolymer transport protein ExbB/TolQ
MTRDRVDALDERVRGVRAAVERLEEKHVTVRRQLQALEAAVDGVPAPDSSSTPGSVLAESASAETAHAESASAETAHAESASAETAHAESASAETAHAEAAEATDEDVAAAVRAVETHCRQDG